MREEDILLWPNGFWCYRFELRDFKRDFNYRVIHYQSEQWQLLSDTQSHFREVASLAPSRRDHDAQGNTQPKESPA